MHVAVGYFDMLYTDGQRCSLRPFTHIDVPSHSTRQVARVRVVDTTDVHVVLRIVYLRPHSSVSFLLRLGVVFSSGSAAGEMSASLLTPISCLAFSCAAMKSG